MKVGELCESCNTFNPGRYGVGKCTICGKDMCNHCANLQVCASCFDHYDYDSATIDIDGTVYVQTIENGEELGDWVGDWVKE